MKLKIILISLLFPLFALGEEDVLPIAPGSMGDFKGNEIKVFAPNPRLVVSTQTQSKKTLSKSSLSKRRVGRQSHLNRLSKSKTLKRNSKVAKKKRTLKLRRPSSTKTKNLRRVERKKKLKRKVSKKGRRSMGRAPASVAERKSRSKNRM